MEVKTIRLGAQDPRVLRDFLIDVFEGEILDPLTPFKVSFGGLSFEFFETEKDQPFEIDLESAIPLDDLEQRFELFKTLKELDEKEWPLTQEEGKLELYSSDQQKWSFRH